MHVYECMLYYVYCWVVVNTQWNLLHVCAHSELGGGWKLVIS